jgi:hypothetical protein
VSNHSIVGNVQFQDLHRLRTTQAWQAGQAHPCSVVTGRISPASSGKGSMRGGNEVIHFLNCNEDDEAA